MEAHGEVVRPGKGNALDAGAGGPSLDAAATEELAPGPVERGIVPVDVANVDPRADDVREAHPGVGEQALGDAEHVVRFLECVSPRAVDVPGVQGGLVAQAHHPRTRSRCAGSARAGGAPTELVRRVRTPGARNHGHRGELELRALVQGRLSDERRRGAAGLEPGRPEHPGPYAARYLAVLTDPSKEHGLADDGLGSRAVRGKCVEQRLVEHFGLPGGIREALARPALHEQLVGQWAAEPTHSDRRAARLDAAIKSTWMHRGRLPTGRDP